jgi:hypothetical protein
MPRPAYEPSEPPPADASLTGQNQWEAAAELLTLTSDFFTSASPAARDELRAFLTSRGCHPATALSWFLDSLQFSAHTMSPPPPGELPDT